MNITSSLTFLTTSNNNPQHSFLYTCKRGLSEASNSTVPLDFPLESRVFPSPELVIVKKWEIGASTKASETDRLDPPLPFYLLAQTSMVYNQVFLVIKLPDTALVYLLACYTAFLATGHAAGLKSINGYLLTIKKFLKNFDPKKQCTDENSTIMFVHYYRNNLNYRIARVDRVNEWVTVKNCYLGLQFNNARTITVSAKS